MPLPALRSSWLFNRTIDLSLVVVPVLFTMVAAAISYLEGPSSGSRVYAGWLSQFVLGNTTHVILTFVLLATRRDLLQATRYQAHIVILGSSFVFAASLAFFWYFTRILPGFSDLAMAAVLVLATHHPLAQVKGLWSLYNLRASKEGIAPNPNERPVMQHWVAISLSFSLVKLLFVSKDTRPDAPPFIISSPGEPALLPYWVTYALMAGWAVFCVWALRAVLSAREVGWPKLVYVVVHLGAVGLTIVSPGWGLVLTSSIHGLEYYFLSGRMLGPTQTETGTWLRKAMIVPVMLVTMVPIFVVGLVGGPFARWFGSLASPQLASDGRIVVNALVIAHYFADAFIYRFRIPEVRKIALRRLGFES